MAARGDCSRSRAPTGRAVRKRATAERNRERKLMPRTGQKRASPARKTSRLSGGLPGRRAPRAEMSAPGEMTEAQSRAAPTIIATARAAMAQSGGKARPLVFQAEFKAAGMDGRLASGRVRKILRTVASFQPR